MSGKQVYIISTQLLMYKHMPSY